MDIETFEMERMQSVYEHAVEHNLTESGVLPMKLGDLLDSDEVVRAFLAQRASYPVAAGSHEIRSRIASWYPEASAENVTVTAGGAEANYTTLWTLLERDARAAIMLPNYMQTWGLARAYGAADPFRLEPRYDEGNRRWGLDIQGLDEAVSASTRVIVVTNPNNPTGAVLTDGEMSAVIEAADRVGAWLLADEIYRGAEIEEDMTTPTFWGLYDKVIVTSGVSKAFGLPGLRVGWIVAPSEMMHDLWRHHDYLSLMPSAVSLAMANIALEPARRELILLRTRHILRDHLPQLEQWITSHSDLFDYIRPRAGAITYLSSRHLMDTRRLAERLRREESVLVVPGEQLGLSNGLRLGFGHDMENTLRGLERSESILLEEQASAQRV